MVWESEATALTSDSAERKWLLWHGCLVSTRPWLPWKPARLFSLAVCILQDCIFISSRSKNSVQLLFDTIAFKFYSVVLVHFRFNNRLNKRDSLALRVNFALDTLVFLANVCDMKPLFSPKLQNTRKMCLFSEDKWKKVKYLTKKWKTSDFVFSQGANFLVN